MIALVLATIAITAEAKGFLHAEIRAKSSQISREDVEVALRAQLGTSRLADIQKFLRPMYTSLPKSESGGLESATVRYALHRYFMQKHGWHINGLHSSNKTESWSAPAVIMKERAPAHILGMFEQNLKGHGLELEGLAVFAAALTDLIHNEAVGSLSEICERVKLPVEGDMTESDMQSAITAYLLSYLSGNRYNFYDLQADVHDWAEDYPGWDDTRLWVRDLKGAFDVSEFSRRNPFVEHKRTFGEVAGFLQEMAHQFGSFQNSECHRIKDQLVDLEHEGTGRVHLSDFYRGGARGEWQFTESVEYLRHIRALDETDPLRMSVVIPNYVGSRTNCLDASSFYSICCSDECEPLLRHVEQEVLASSALPQRIAEVVSELESDTVPAPRNLSISLLSRLESIAQLHNGRVPLHGRLFAQWMHHAFPRECKFPFVAAGSHNIMSPLEWSEAMDLDSAEATEEEMSAHLEMTTETKGKILPWIDVEELVAENKPVAQQLPWQTRGLTQTAAVCLGAVAMVVKLYSSAMAVWEPTPGKIDKFMV